MNLTPYMIRLTKARPERLRATIFVAPGRAQELVKRLHDRDIGSWAHSDSTIRVEDPMSLLILFERTGICVGINKRLADYVELRSFLRPGQKRAQDVVERLTKLVNEILEVQGD